jgi:hypothetical protein
MIFWDITAKAKKENLFSRQEENGLFLELKEKEKDGLRQ